MRIEIHEARGENFLLYESITLDLHNQGLVRLSGQYNHDTSQSNRVGKTTSIGLVFWIIWEKLLRDVRDISRVITFGETKCTGELTGTINGEPFWIKRVRTGKSVTLTASFARSSRTPEVQAEINAIFGTFDLAQNTVFLSRKKAMEFLVSSDSQRRKLLEELLKIKEWSERQERVREDIKWATSEQAKVANYIQVCSLQLAALEAQAQHDRELQLTKLASELEALNTACSGKSDELQAVLNHEKLVSDKVAKLEKSLHQLKYAADMDARDLKFARETQSKIDAKTDELDHYRTSLSMNECPTCGSPIEPDEDSLRTVTQELEALIQTKVFPYLSVEELTEKSDASMQEYNDQCAVLFAERRELTNTREQATKLDTRLALDRRAILSVQEEYDRLYGLPLEDNQQEIAFLREMILVWEDIMSDLEECLKFLGLLNTGFGYKGIPSRKVSRSLPLLTDKLNSVLSVLSSNTLEVDIIIGDATKDDRIVDKLNFLARDEGVDVYLEECSTGQQQRIVISLFLALSMVQHSLTGVSWNIAMMDELFDGLDSHGVAAVVRVLLALKNDRSSPLFSTVIVTSHKSELAGMVGFDKEWLVVREGKRSQLHVKQA